MNEQEVIEILKKLEGSILSKRVEDALLMAINLLQKQIPKKPDIEGDGYADGHLVYDTWICPNCGEHYEIDYDNYDYCPKCGQAIDKSFMDQG